MRKYKLVKEKKVTYPLDEWYEVERRAAALSMKTGTYIRQISVNGQIVKLQFQGHDRRDERFAYHWKKHQSACEKG